MRRARRAGLELQVPFNELSSGYLHESVDDPKSSCRRRRLRSTRPPRLPEFSHRISTFLFARSAPLTNAAAGFFRSHVQARPPSTRALAFDPSPALSEPFYASAAVRTAPRRASSSPAPTPLRRTMSDRESKRARTAESGAPVENPYLAHLNEPHQRTYGGGAAPGSASPLDGWQTRKITGKQVETAMVSLPSACDRPRLDHS